MFSGKAAACLLGRIGIVVLVFLCWFSLQWEVWTSSCLLPPYKVISSHCWTEPRSVGMIIFIGVCDKFIFWPCVLWHHALFQRTMPLSSGYDSVVFWTHIYELLERSVLICASCLHSKSVEMVFHMYQPNTRRSVYCDLHVGLWCCRYMYELYDLHKGSVVCNLVKLIEWKLLVMEEWMVVFQQHWCF